MNRWEEKFKEHSIHETMKQLVNVSKNNIGKSDPVAMGEWSRLLKVIRMYSRALRNFDPHLIPLERFDWLNGSFLVVLKEINLFIKDSDVSCLARANNTLDPLMSDLSSWILFSNKAIREKPKEEIQKLRANINTCKTEAESFLSDEQNHFSIAQQERGSEFTLAQEERKSEFTGNEEERDKKYTEWKESKEVSVAEDIKTLISETRERLRTEEEIFAQKMVKLSEKGKERYQDILDLHGLVAGGSVSAGHSADAEYEKKQADTWRWVSIGFLAGAIIWVSSVNFMSEKYFAHGGVLWFKAFSAFSLTGILLWGSAYSSQQSTQHRNNGKKTKWFALETMAIDPFISSLDIDAQKELKMQLSERLFGQSAQIKSHETNVMDEHVLSIPLKVIAHLAKIFKS